MRSRVIFGVAIALLLISATATTAQTLTEALNAFSAHEIDHALELFKAVYTNGTDSKDRAIAARAASVLLWRYYKQHDEGRELLLESRSLGAELADSTYALARLEEDAGRYPEALDAAALSCLFAESDQEALSAKIRYASIIIDPHVEEALRLSSTIPAAVQGKLQTAHAILRTLVSTDPGDLASSRLLLLSSIILGDGPAALKAWRSYYRIAEGVSVGKILDDANKKLSEFLPDWSGEDSTIDTAIAIARALAASRMYQPAAMFINKYIPVDQRPEDIVDTLNYGLLTFKMTELTDEYYRKTAIGEGDYPAYFAELVSMIKETWEAGSWTDEEFPIAAPFTEENVRAQRDGVEAVRQTLLEQLGAYIALGSTAGYKDLHYGHVVVDDNRTIDQYGNTAEVRFLLLDNIVSNGFQSWAWDYRSQHGGWANDIGIFQIRPAYTSTPMRVWRTLNDPKKMEEGRAEMEKKREEDLARAEDNTITYYPSVRDQLTSSSQMELLEKLKAENLTNSELQTRFVAELTKIQQNYSIFAHEGRHFIDKRNGVTGGEELEFRAKLSEIAFSEIPKMALAGAIYSSNLGSKTPHGQANQRVMQGIVDWMLAHAGEITDLDNEMPMLMQLNKLTDNQVRAAVRSIDPLAQEAAEASSH